MDLNNQVVMSDGSTLPRAEGEGGVAKVIKDWLSGNVPSSSGPMATNASNVELVSEESYYNDEPKELAVLGEMEFDVVPAERTDKSKQLKPYDRKESKKVVEKTLPEVPQRSSVPPNRAYVELPPTILKRLAPVLPIQPRIEDEEMNESLEDAVPSSSKGKQREAPVIVPVVNRVPNIMSQLPKVERSRVPAQKDAPKFEVANPRVSSDKQRNHVPQYKYGTEIMDGINQESVFQKLLSQLVTMKLGEILGSSFELGR